MRITRHALVAVCAAAVAAPALAEDLTIVFKATGKDGGATSTSYYSSEKMRTGDGQNETIIEYGTGRITAIDHKKKEYSEITLAEMEAAMKAMSAKMDEARKQLDAMPAAMREKMQQMMGGVASSVTVTKGGTRQVAGYTCQDYTVTMGEAMTSKMCATTALSFPAPSVDVRKFQNLAGSFATMANNPMFQNMEKLTEEMRKIEGFTIAESTSMKVLGRSFDSGREAVEITKGAIPAAAFDVAAIAKGYKKVAHPVTKMK